MTSKNGRPELVSLLQYMKNTRLDNPEITVKDDRIVRLDEIVQEVKQSEEWEAVKMNLIEIGEARGQVRGQARGEKMKLISQVCKKLDRGTSPEVIAEALEEDFDVIERICEAAKEFAPEYDCDKIYLKLHKNN